jgi:hypothetical protein
MPYITQERQHALAFNAPETPGDLNYAITTLCLDWLAETGKSYADYNTVVGVLESAKLEFYRRAVAKYEDQKIKENGDVYP